MLSNFCSSIIFKPTCSSSGSQSPKPILAVQGSRWEPTVVLFITWHVTTTSLYWLRWGPFRIASELNMHTFGCERNQSTQRKPRHGEHMQSPHRQWTLQNILFLFNVMMKLCWTNCCIWELSVSNLVLHLNWIFTLIMDFNWHLYLYVIS